MKLAYTLLIYLLATQFLCSQSRELPSFSGNFLDAQTSLYSIANGGAGIASLNDYYGASGNIAKSIFLESEAYAGLSFQPLFRNLGVNDIYLLTLFGYKKLNDNHALSSSLRYNSLGNFEFTDQTGVPNAFLYELAFSASYSIRLSNNLASGITLKYIYSDLGRSGVEQQASAFAVDFSLSYHKATTESTNMGAALSVNNIGTPLSYEDGTSSPLPRKITAGGAYEIEIASENILELLLQYEAFLFEEYLSQLGLGASYKSPYKLIFSAGYNIQIPTDVSAQFFSAGVNYRIKGISLDFNIQQYLSPSNPLSTVWSIGLGYIF